MLSDQHDPNCKKDGCPLIPLCVASRPYGSALLVALKALRLIRKDWNPDSLPKVGCDPFTVAKAALDRIKKMMVEGF